MSFGIVVVHNAVGIFGSRTDFENHHGYRVVYIILTVEGRRMGSERTKLCRIWLNQIFGFSFECLLCLIDHLWLA